MKSDDLERLEESQEMKQLIRSAKERYEQEKSAQPPVPYSVFARTLKERQKGEKMEVKQKYGKRSEISPWWLVAACLLGCIIGYGVSNTPDSRETDTDRLAVTDTVIIVHERVDTVYREVKVPSQSLVASQAAPRSKDTKLPGERVKPDRIERESEPAFISIEFLQQQRNLPDPDSECYAANGMTVAEGNYPFHLLATVPCK